MLASIFMNAHFVIKFSNPCLVIAVFIVLLAVLSAHQYKKMEAVVVNSLL